MTSTDSLQSSTRTSTQLRTVIVDDEPLARAHLRKLSEALGVEVIGEAPNALIAIQQAEELNPDVMFLDVQMPEISGLQLAGTLILLERPPLIVFVTGYSEHALAAFDHDALDYLVKPVASDRLARTLAKVRSRLMDKNARQAVESRIEEKSREAPLRRLPVREQYSVRLLRVEDIFCATARNKRVYIHTEDAEYSTYYTLTQLEYLLPHEAFCRVHESAIVNLNRIEEIHFLGNHSYRISLTNSIQIPVGRSRYADLQKRLGLDSISLP